MIHSAVVLFVRSILMSQSLTLTPTQTSLYWLSYEVSYVPENNKSIYLLCGVNFKIEFAHSAGFKPARAEPNRFLVYRLNHSAMTASYLAYTFDCIVSYKHIPYRNNDGKVNVIFRLLSEKCFAAGRIRTCAGRAHWISSPTP